MVKHFAKKWLFSRMAAQEFGFKRPFVIEEEFPVMMIILILALIPLEGIGLFAYARIVGSIQQYNPIIFVALILVNYLIARWLIGRVKTSTLPDETMREYESMSRDERKRFYSFRAFFPIIFNMAVLPWLIAVVAIFLICVIYPR